AHARAARLERGGQVDDPQNRPRPAQARCRRRPYRHGSRRRRADGAHRLRRPGGRALSAPHGGAQRDAAGACGRVEPTTPGGAPRGARHAGGARARADATLPAPAERRTGTAREPDAGADAGSAGPPARRAAGRARSHHAREPPDSARADLRRPAQERRRRHPRRSRGVRVRLGDHAHEPWPRRAAGHAGRSRAASRRSIRVRILERASAAARDDPGAGPVTRRASLGLAVLALLLAAGVTRAERPTLRVGSKSFTESYILAEIVAQIIDDTGEARAERRLGLGGTGLAWGALAGGAIDIYPEYTGTIAQAILKDPALTSVGAMRAALDGRGVIVGTPLGFDNTYALAVRRDEATRLGLRTIGDLAHHPGLRAAFDPGFLERADGWPGLSRRYGLRFADVHVMEHALTYPALAAGRVDVIDVFSTDGQLARLDLV